MPFAQRHIEGELMDDPALGVREHAAALRGLRRINLASRTAASLWPAIARIMAEHHPAMPSLLDVACGGGDVAIALSHLALRKGLALEVQGCDISETALEQAAANAERSHAPVRFLRLDALVDPLPAHCTIVTATLFLHHLSDDQIVILLRKFAAHADHVIISDLIRGPAGYALAWIGTRLLSASPIVHVDGLRSVRAALTVAEARALADAAGLDNARFERCWPRRFLMTWSRQRAPSAEEHRGN